MSSTITRRHVAINETRSATYSPCERYRYSLDIHFGNNSLFHGGTCCFVGLNPSTATELVDDPTITRIKNFVRSWGFARLIMLNAYAFRSTDPRGLLAVDDPVGDENNKIIWSAASTAAQICLGWGTHCRPDRRNEVFRLLRPVDARCVCLGTNNDGSPKHPLYLSSATQRERFFIPLPEGAR